MFSDAQAMLSYLVNMLIILVPDDFFPLKVKGEACGSCDCPPRNTEGECETGLECVRNQLMPGLPGTCMESGNFDDKGKSQPPEPPEAVVNKVGWGY